MSRYGRLIGNLSENFGDAREEMAASFAGLSAGRAPLILRQMSLITVEVEIDHGKLTPKQPHLLPETGRGMLTVFTPAAADNELKPEIVAGPDGHPVIRTPGVITAALVREIEGLAS